MSIDKRKHLRTPKNVLIDDDTNYNRFATTYGHDFRNFNTKESIAHEYEN